MPLMADGRIRRMSDAAPKSSSVARLNERLEKLGLFSRDIVEKFVLGSGKGGQKINKTSSCVYLRHRPSGIEVKCQRGRSRELNRYYARQELCDKYEERILGEITARRQEQEKIRRQKRRRSRRAKAKMLEDKKQHSEKKQMRRRVDDDR